MNLTDLQVELREIETIQNSLVSRLSALHGEIEKMKPQDKPKLDIDFARITSEAEKKPLVREELRAAQSATKKSFFSALSYLIALDSEQLEDKLYYLCRLAQGCDYQASAEELCQMGWTYDTKDLASLGLCLGGLHDRFIVEALVLANMAGLASRDVLGALSSLADSLGIVANEMRGLGRSAEAMLCFGIELSTLMVGDTFTLGNYPQCANSEVRPIEWLVLRRDSDGLLVISKYALDHQPYNEENRCVNWSGCTLRKWLNSEFVTLAFTERERQRIKEVHLKNPKSHWNNVTGGPSTADKIFLLSHDEADKLFSSKVSRLCQSTEYAKQNEVKTNDDGVCSWWLRSPGNANSHAACVYSDGGIVNRNVSNDNIAVRPSFIITF